VKSVHYENRFAIVLNIIGQLAFDISDPPFEDTKLQKQKLCLSLFQTSN